MAKSKRNYAKEYANYQGKPEQIARRSSRNKAARKRKCGGDVDHIDGNPKNNAAGNLRCASAGKNRSFARTKTARKASRLRS